MSAPPLRLPPPPARRHRLAATCQPAYQPRMRIPSIPRPSHQPHLCTPLCLLACLPGHLTLSACLSLPACLHAGRAEPVKLALAAKGIDFEVCDVDYAEMKADNVKYPFHQCPRCAAAGSRATASQHACMHLSLSAACLSLALPIIDTAMRT